MVLLCVKGTKYPDEFLFECSCADSVAAVTESVIRIQNARHQCRLQLYSMGEIATALKTGSYQFGGCAASAAPQPPNADLVARYVAKYDELMALHKDTKYVVPSTQTFDDHWAVVKSLTAELFPKEMTHADGDDAAVTKLYELHENPDLDEDYRLHVYHCRAILDPDWRGNERSDVTKSALWFCGKSLDKTKTVGDYCHQNAKSKLTVKVALESGPAPSGEPRMSYDDQRAMRNHVCARREVYKQLEDSELRDKVLQQARGKVIVTPTAVGSDSMVRVTGIKKFSVRDDAAGEAKSGEADEASA